MFKAFLEAPRKAQAATICFLLAKLMFVASALALLVSKTVAIAAVSLYSFLVLSTIALCLAEGTSKGKKSYKGHEE